MIPELPKSEVITKAEAFFLLESSNAWRAREEQKGHRVSLPLAIATRMQLDAQEELDSKIAFVGRKEDLAELSRRLKYLRGGENISNLLKLAGRAALRSTLESLEQAAVEGYWLDNAFIERLNSNIVNTHISPVEWRYIGDPEEQIIRAEEEGKMVRQTLFEQKNFLGFLKTNESGEYSKLPKSISEFFGRHLLWKIGFEQSIPVFTQAVKGL